MSMIAINPARPGYSTISPFLSVKNPEQQLEFIKTVFAPEITEPVRINPDQRAELKIGNTSLIVVKAEEEHHSRTNTLYVYVKNIRETYVKALGSGAKSLHEPFERYNGDWECEFEDQSGTLWICARFEKQLTHDAMMERLRNHGIRFS